METEKSFSIYVERAIIVYLHRKPVFLLYKLTN